MVGLKTYKVKDKEIYENLRKMFSGIAFFRSEKNEYFIKVTKNPTIDEFLKLGLLFEVC
jgi:hypothetical protein